jgi:hypothetical protein
MATTPAPTTMPEAKADISGLYHHQGILYCAAGPYLYSYDPSAAASKGVWNLMSFRLLPKTEKGPAAEGQPQGR